MNKDFLLFLIRELQTMKIFSKKLLIVLLVNIALSVFFFFVWMLVCLNEKFDISTNSQAFTASIIFLMFQISFNLWFLFKLKIFNRLFIALSISAILIFYLILLYAVNYRLMI